jgi:hypothetical protein
MITRGHYIGEIIDELSTIAAQVKMRNQLGMTDLSVLVENFFRDLLNEVLDAKLVNLNKERSNAPGLDLGDLKGALAIQVTATSSKKKVEDALTKISDSDRKKYGRFVVLVVGQKQGSYALDEKLTKPVGFSKEHDIWDLETVARLSVGLNIARLEAAHRVVRSEVARVKIELEAPDAEGNYPTNGYDHWEPPAKEQIGDGAAFSAFSHARSGEPVDPKLPQALRSLSKKLARLPRITREFLVVLLERQIQRKSKRFHAPWMTILYDKVSREYRGGDLKGELGLLSEAGFAEFRDDDEHYSGPAEIGVRIPSKCDELAYDFMEFVNDKNLSLRKVIGEVDLSAF